MGKNFLNLIIMSLCFLLVSCAGKNTPPPKNIDCTDSLSSSYDYDLCNPEKDEDLFYKISYGSFMFNDLLCVKIVEPLSEIYAFIVPKDIRTRFSGFINIFLDFVPNITGSIIEFRPDKTIAIIGKTLIDIPFGISDAKWNIVKVDLEEKNISQALATKWDVPTGRYGVLPFIGPFYPLEIPDIILGNSLGSAAQMGFATQVATNSVLTINNHSVSEGNYIWVTKTHAVGNTQYTTLRTSWEQYWWSKIANK